MVFMGVIKALLELYILVLYFIKVMPDVSILEVLFFKYKLYLNRQVSWTWKLFWDVQADAGFLCNEGAVHTDIMNSFFNKQ